MKKETIRLSNIATKIVAMIFAGICIAVGAFLIERSITYSWLAAIFVPIMFLSGFILIYSIFTDKLIIDHQKKEIIVCNFFRKKLSFESIVYVSIGKRDNFIGEERNINWGKLNNAIDEFVNSIYFKLSFGKTIRCRGFSKNINRTQEIVERLNEILRTEQK